MKVLGEKGVAGDVDASSYLHFLRLCTVAHPLPMMRGIYWLLCDDNGL